MSHPQPGELAFAKTVFVSAGTPGAILVTNTAGRRRRKTLRVANAHAALDWCQTHAAMLVYLPSPPTATN